MKIELDSWSEAEIDLILAKEVAGMLSEALYNEGLKHHSDVAYAVARNIDNALAWVEGGRIHGRD